MKLKNSFIRILSIIAILVLICTSIVMADTYEYNDVRIFVGNVQRTTIALTSNTYIGQNTDTYFDVAFYLSDNHIKICNQGGSILDTGIEVTGISQVDATQDGNPLTVTYIQNGYMGGNSGSQYGPTRLFRVYYNTKYYDSIISLSINGSSVKLQTPVVTQNGNSISWSPIANASGYNIMFKANAEDSFNRIVSNSTQTSYSFSNSGYYVVQAVGQGNFYNSDWSNVIEVEYDPDDQDILGFFQRVIDGLNNAFQTVSNFLSTIGNTFDSLFAFLPEEVRIVFWSVIIIGLVLSLFMK